MNRRRFSYNSDNSEPPDIRAAKLLHSLEELKRTLVNARVSITRLNSRITVLTNIHSFQTDTLRKMREGEEVSFARFKSTQNRLAQLEQDIVAARSEVMQTVASVEKGERVLKSKSAELGLLQNTSSGGRVLKFRKSGDERA